MKKDLQIILWMCCANHVVAQFPGPAGTAGSAAMHRDSSAFVGWASACNILRGYQNIANKELGLTSTGEASFATGLADGSGTVSLGDSGVAVLTFDAPIYNGDGFDFAVFENAFDDKFLELAFVEVSSNGIDFVRFPATSLTQVDSQINTYDHEGDATKLNNLAGKYRTLFGTPFDLEELADSNGIDIDSITHVRIVDVVGSIDSSVGTMDHLGNMINDPFPTAFEPGGFDLDAVGVIHQIGAAPNGITSRLENNIRIFPNPAVAGTPVHVASSTNVDLITVFNLFGEIVQQHVSHSKQLELKLESGTYFLQVRDKNENYSRPLIVQ